MITQYLLRAADASINILVGKGKACPISSNICTRRGMTKPIKTTTVKAPTQKTKAGYTSAERTEFLIPLLFQENLLTA